MIPLRGGRGAESRLGTCASRELALCVGCLDKTSVIAFEARSLGAWLGGRVLTSDFLCLHRVELNLLLTQHPQHNHVV